MTALVAYGMGSEYVVVHGHVTSVLVTTVDGDCV